MPVRFDWTQLEKLEAAVAWRRETENAALANVWHLETVADLASELRRLLELDETDTRLIGLLWLHLSDDQRGAILEKLQAPASRYPNGAMRLSDIVCAPPT